jgi:hypothetical protein
MSTTGPWTETKFALDQVQSRSLGKEQGQPLRLCPGTRSITRSGTGRRSITGTGTGTRSMAVTGTGTMTTRRKRDISSLRDRCSISRRQTKMTHYEHTVEKDCNYILYSPERGQTLLGRAELSLRCSTAKAILE